MNDEAVLCGKLCSDLAVENLEHFIDSYHNYIVCYPERAAKTQWKERVKYKHTSREADVKQSECTRPTSFREVQLDQVV